MGVFTPSEVFDKTIDSAEVKAGAGAGKLFLLGILAGMYIAFGAFGSTTASFNLLADVQTYGLGKVVMGAVFPVGLMLVILCGGELFTGNCLMVTGLMEKKIRLSRILRNWVIVYGGNLAGSLVVALAVSYSGLLSSGDGLLGAMTIKIAAGKCALDFGKALVLGVFCNILVCLAILMATAAKDGGGKILAIWFCIALFVISGYEHSIANMYFIPAGLMAAADGAYTGILNVSTDSLTISGFVFNNLLPVTIGNIIGGSLVVGGAYWLAHRKLG